MDLAPVRTLALRQHGVISLTQAAALGIGRPRWRALCRDGVLVELLADVALVGGAPATDLALVKAGLLVVGEPSLVSHTTAALVWGASVAGILPVHLSVADRRDRGRPIGVLVHRPRDVLELEPIVWQRLPTTRPLRTLVDIGGVDPDAVEPALRRFLVAGFVTPTVVRAALRRHRRSGRAGVVALEAALDGLALGDKPPDSELEEVMAMLFRTHGLPPFEFHAVIEGWEVDFLVTGTRVVIETDGWTTHGLDREQFESDRVKDGALEEAGYVVRRFTWTKVTREPRWVAERIRAMLRRWAPEILDL